MSRKPVKKIYPKEPETHYMSNGVYQPLSVKNFTLAYLDETNVHAGLLLHMFARLLAVLVGRKLLNAPDFYYVVTGTWHKTVEFSTWTPEQELDEGLQPGVILNR